MSFLNRFIGYLIFETKIGLWLFCKVIGLIYDVFWIIGFVQGLWKAYFGDDD